MELTVEIVKAARELISDRAHWAKGYYAGLGKNPETDAVRDSVDPMHEGAVCFCSLGAVRVSARRAGASGNTAEKDFCTAVVGCVPKNYVKTHDSEEFALVADFNDAPETSHEDVLGAFDCLIAKMESAS